jgi:AcrR family transcriptional regulator
VRAVRPYFSRKKEAVFLNMFLTTNPGCTKRVNVHSAPFHSQELSMSSDAKNIRVAILDAALELFSEHGFHCAPISQIATRAGVGVGSIYRYFSDKDALIHAVYEKVDGPLQCAMKENMSTSVSIDLHFRHFVGCVVRYLYSHPKEFRFLEQYHNSPYGINQVQAKVLQQDDGRPTDLCTEIFLKGQQEGIIKKLPLPVYISMLFGPVSYMVRYSLSGYAELDETLIQTLADACWNAIRA